MGQLGLHGHVVASLKQDEVVAAHLRDGHEHVLDLLRIDVDPAYDQHVVGAAGDARQAAVGAATGTETRDDRCDIARAVAQKRHGLAAQGGQHQFARLAVGQRLVRPGIDDLDDEVVFPKVHAGPLDALECHAWAVHL